MEILHQPGVPIEIMKMDDRSIQLYEEAIKDGTETVYSIRIIVVGHMGVGKTTLVKRLLGEEVNISDRHSKEGIDVYVNCCDVSLATNEWTRRAKDSIQDYRLQRIDKVLNEQHSVAGKVSDELILNPLDEDITESLKYTHADVNGQDEQHSVAGKASDELVINPLEENITESLKDTNAAVKDQNADVLHCHSSEQDIDQDILSATNQQEVPTAHKLEEYAVHELKESTGHKLEESTAHELEESAVYQLEESTATELVVSTAHKLEESTAHELGVSTAHELEESTAHKLQESTAHKLEESTAHDQEESTAHALEKPTARELEESTARKLEESTALKVEKSTAHELEEYTSHKLEESTAHKLEKSTAHEQEESTTHELEKSTDQELEESTAYKLEESTAHELKESTAHELEEYTAHKPEESTSHELEDSTVRKLEKSTAYKVEEFTAHELEEYASHKLDESTAHKLEEYTDQELEESTAHKLEESTAHELKKSTAYKLEESTDHELETSTAHDLKESRAHKPEESTDHELEKSTAHELEESTAHELEESTAHKLDKSTAHKLEESTAHELDESTAHQKEESTSHEQEESASAVVHTKSTDVKASTITMMKLLKENVNKIEGSGKNPLLTIWDCAYLNAFYTTHQTFRTRRAIYLLVFDVSGQVTDLVADDFYFFDSKGMMKCQVHVHVEVWLNSIHSCAESPEADSPPVILVGTHVDKLSLGKKHKICKRYFSKIRSYLKDKPTRFHLIDEDFAIDNTVVDRKLKALKKKIVEVASQQPYWGEKIPARWLPLEQELMRRKASGVKVMSRADVEKINKEGTVPIEKNEELDLFLRYLHATGTIIYFSIEILRENILLDPTWLIDALKTLINDHPELPEGPADNVVSQTWSDFKGKGILSSELIDGVWTKEKHPELHAHKGQILLIMEHLNIIAKPRAFSEIGEKVENYFLTPCMLRQESPKDIICPKQDPMLFSTPVLCFVFKGKFLPPPIFHRLIAACLIRWPVAKKKGTSENLIFSGCCIFDLDLFHRLTLHCKNHIVFARITRLVVDEVKTPDETLCTRVRKFITVNLSKITSYLGQNLKYDVCTWWSSSQVYSDDGIAVPFQMWFEDEGHDTDGPISPEHMNHARLYVALVTVCKNALRDILLTHVPVPYTNIYKAIRAKKADLTMKTQTRKGQLQNALLLPDQCHVVFPDPRSRYVASVDQFDITLLYILIRNVSTVSASFMDWGIDPIEQPFRDKCLGASVERIRSYRNQIGHSMDGKMSKHDFDDYWNKIDAVLHDIEQALGRRGYYRALLDKQKRQVISVYEAC